MNKRRELVKNMVAVQAVIVAPGLFWLPRSADAILPGIVARILLGSFMRRGASRVASSALRRQVATRTTGNVSQRLVQSSASRSAVSSSASRSNVSGLSVKGVALSAASVSGLSVSFSPKIYAMSKEYGADIVWARDGHTNSFEYDIQNPTSVSRTGSLDLFVKDANSDQIIEQIPLGLIQAKPQKTFNYSFELERFDYEGVIKLFSESSEPELVAPPSGNIIVANSDEIFVREN